MNGSFGNSTTYDSCLHFLDSGTSNTVGLLVFSVDCSGDGDLFLFLAFGDCFSWILFVIGEGISWVELLSGVNISQKELSWLYGWLSDPRGEFLFSVIKLKNR